VKREKPFSVCRVCLKSYSRDRDSLDGRCTEERGGKRCEGGVVAKVGLDDWNQCKRCEASGWINGSASHIGFVKGRPCHACGGVGWMLARPDQL
jgi:DnaJ-class molecular chaperone